MIDSDFMQWASRPEKARRRIRRQHKAGARARTYR